ncbi:MAG: replication protein [Romboutsia sp.]
MAVYRHIHIEYWQDGFVLDLTPEEKYFYIYLMTNSKTSQCGIYELPKRIIETETGYNRETVEKLIYRFEEYEKVVYCEDTKELFLKNWIKHNKVVSHKVKKCIEKELKNVKINKHIELFLN